MAPGELPFEIRADHGVVGVGCKDTHGFLAAITDGVD
jgi:hypothetical protein